MSAKINTEFAKLLAEVERATDQLTRINTRIYELMDAYDAEQVERKKQQLEDEGKLP